jgi:mannose-1-phosphate guanylyltransferase/mannose-6-phosphate isomerase
MVSKKYSDKKPLPAYEAGRVNLYALILAGGTGSRFWPFSRELEPKQFMSDFGEARLTSVGQAGINIFGKESLLQNTISRLCGLVRPDKTYIITNHYHFHEVKRQIEKFRISDKNILLEPQGKNTAAAIGLCARLILKGNPQALLISLPADHYIRDMAGFRKTLRQAIECSDDDFLVTIGIRPDKPATGYGYIKISHRSPRRFGRGRQVTPTLRSGQAGHPDASVGAGRSVYYKVEKFLEKPGLSKAKRYAASKNYFWNSGIFVWKASVFMEEMRKYLPYLYSSLMSIAAKDDIIRVWPEIKPISVDYGIMEHSKRIALIPGDFGWSDLGSWDALQGLLPKDKRGNVIHADLIDYKSKGISAFSRGGRLIATLGLKDLIIADTPDALLVCDKNKAQDVKKIVEKLKLNKRKEHIAHTTDRRPWGSFTVLRIGDGFKIKLIEIEPGKRLSLQRHRRRAEHWVVVSGCAKVTSAGAVKLVKSNQSIYIAQGIKHRLENPAKTILKIVEVQTGTYLEEDDIERFEDDFKR